jgi:hypothetical protein
MPYLSYEANFRQERRTDYVQAINDEYISQRSANASVPQEIARSLTERVSREFSTNGYRHLQVPDEPDLETFPYRDYDSDSDFSDDLDPGNPDDLEEEEKALVRSYLHSPPALHVRR